MTQKEDETLEDYLDRFLFNVKKSKHNTLSEESLKLIFLREINEDYIESLDLMGGRDITQVPWDDIRKICQKYSRLPQRKVDTIGLNLQQQKHLQQF